MQRRLCHSCFLLESLCKRMRRGVVRLHTWAVAAQLGVSSDDFQHGPTKRLTHVDEHLILVVEASHSPSIETRRDCTRSDRSDRTQPPLPQSGERSVELEAVALMLVMMRCKPYGKRRHIRHWAEKFIAYTAQSLFGGRDLVNSSRYSSFSNLPI